MKSGTIVSVDWAVRGSGGEWTVFLNPYGEHEIDEPCPAPHGKCPCSWSDEEENHMPKDDPLSQQLPTTLWLDRESMEQARENFWRAFEATRPTTTRNLDDRAVWDVAWAAAIAAFSFLQEGRIRP